MKTSAYRLMCDALIGKTIRFLVKEIDFLDGGKPKRKNHESESSWLLHEGLEIDEKWTETGSGSKIRNVIIEDKIIKIEFKQYHWLLHTLEGYTLKRSYDEDIIVDDN